MLWIPIGSPKPVSLFTINLTGKTECAWKVSNSAVFFLNKNNINRKSGIHMWTFHSLLVDSEHTHHTTCGSVVYDTSSAGQERQMTAAEEVMEMRDRSKGSSFHLLLG